MRNGVLAAAIMVCVAGGAAADTHRHTDDCFTHGAHAVPDTLAFADLATIRDYFAAAHYTLDDWNAGERTVPRYYLARVPSRWRHDVAPGLPVHLKKRYFFFAYAPLVLECNEDIALLRDRLVGLHGADALSPADGAWLRDLAATYRLDVAPDADLGPDLTSQLLRRVDIVPASLALAQAAVESGWSTSRFADLGNALFGQWTWGDDGITPEQQRDHLGDYRIKAFATPEQSIAAYMHNLNTHPGYADFRERRHRLRADGKRLSGRELAPGLTAYSELGQEYVETLLSVIRVNHLPAADDAYLRDMKPVMLVPVGEGSD